MTAVPTSDWMQTYTGRRFWPLEPRVKDVDIVDIAHSLAHQCRYAGHTTRFYSVAEHCVLLSRTVDARYALDALLHDAAEAYCVDVPRPLKRNLPGYAEMEDRVLDVIMRAVAPPAQRPRGGQYWIPTQVKIHDNRILLDERAALLTPSGYSWHPFIEDQEPLGVDVRGNVPAQAERHYLERFAELTGASS